MVRRGTGSAAELKLDTFGVATPSVGLQFGRNGILWMDAFSLFFTGINIFVA